MTADINPVGFITFSILKEQYVQYIDAKGWPI